MDGLVFLLRRDVIVEDWTHGQLMLRGQRIAFTLEDPIRELVDASGRWYWRSEFKVQKRTAIPSGRYRLGLHKSPRFGRELPHVLDVPDFRHVLMHGGNDVDDTEGCVLCGASRDITAGKLANCGPTIDKIASMLRVALPVQPCFLEVRNP